MKPPISWLELWSFRIDISGVIKAETVGWNVDSMKVVPTFMTLIQLLDLMYPSTTTGSQRWKWRCDILVEASAWPPSSLFFSLGSIINAQCNPIIISRLPVASCKLRVRHILGGVAPDCFENNDHHIIKPDLWALLHHDPLYHQGFRHSRHPPCMKEHFLEVIS